MEFALIAIPFLLAGAIPLLTGFVSAKWISRGIAATLLGLFLWTWTLLPAIHHDGAIIRAYPWVSQFDLSLELYLDGLSAIFVLLITGIGSAVFLYAGYYLDGDERAPRFLLLLSAFTGSMLGVVLSGNLLLLFVCWELTSIFSFMLIGFDGKKPEARSAATQALVVTGGGGLALLVGLILLGLGSGSASMVDVLNTPMQEHPWYSAILILVLVGCFTKSAQFPFHFWLPGGMTAPTPASSFLHSATMVKAGIYLLARLYPVLGDTATWLVILAAVGMFTMFMGATLALRQRDLKGMLAYATVSWLGALVLMLSLPHYEGFKAAIIGIVAHALYKSTLFMVAGAIDHAKGTRIIDKLGGLAREMPGAAGIAIISCLSMAGMIPLLGFVAKETLLEAMIEFHEPAGILLLIGVSVSALFTVTVACIYVWDVFFGSSKPQAANHKAHDAHNSHSDASGHDSHDDHGHHNSPMMLVGPGIVASMSLIGAILLEPVLGEHLELAAHTESHYHLFAGFNSVFFLSLGLIGGGVVLFLLRNYWLRIPIPSPTSGAKIYMGFMKSLAFAGDNLLKAQSGKLSSYMAIILGVVGILIALPAFQYLSGITLNFTALTGRNIVEIALLLISIVSIIASIIFKQHLMATLALGVGGYAIAGIFLLVPGPDIALVQVLVETLAAVLVMIMLSRITERKRRKASSVIWGASKKVLRRDILISVLVGVGVGVFALAAAINRPNRDTRLANYYLETTAPEVGITDVVGAIITDFRGTDTLFEITVFTMAAMGVLTVLYLSRTAAKESEEAPQINVRITPSQISTPLTKLTTKLLLPISMVIAIAHILYGGDAPGDGFTAGVIGGISVALWYQVFGYDRSKLRNIRVEALLGLGLSIGIGNAVLPLFMGKSFLEHYNIVDVALPGNLHITSATVFEVAIFLTVFAAIITMINAMTNPEGIEEL